MSKQYTSLKTNEQGIVSILVTMIIMIVLSLIVTGFAQLARREQREALDRQLNTQAFYAAESGINDARRAIKEDSYAADKTDCGPISSVPSLKNNVISSDGLIQYSCLLIKQTLPFTQHVITPDNSRTIPMNAVSGGAPVTVTGLEINWTAQGGGVILPGRSVGEFPALGDWGSDKVGVLRVDIIPLAGSIDPNNMAGNMVTFFAYPSNTGGSATPANNGGVVAANCASECNLKVTGLAAASSYYVRLRAIYNPLDVKMCMQQCGGTTLVQGSQAEIDSTGKANDVLKRIKVRVDDVSDVADMDNFPDFALESKDAICKVLEVWPGDAKPATLTACGLTP